MFSANKQCKILSNNTFYYSHLLAITVPHPIHPLHNTHCANDFYSPWTTLKKPSSSKILTPTRFYPNFPKFLCHSLTTCWNFYLPPPPSKLFSFALIQRTGRDFRDQKRRWKSFRVSVFNTFFKVICSPSTLSKHHPLSSNSIFGNTVEAAYYDYFW
jgi:hypothetical protein